MRSAVSVILSSSAPEQNMSYPDYEQTPHDHQALLIVIRHIGQQLRTKQFNRAFERISRLQQIKIFDSQNHPRNITLRYLKNYPVENNDWGDFQTHRKALGLISIGQCNSQDEFNELCRIHESLKVKYAWTLYDSRCILYGLNSDGTIFEGQHSSDVSPCVDTSDGNPIFPSYCKNNKDSDSASASISITGSITSLETGKLENSHGGFILPRNAAVSSSNSIDEGAEVGNTEHEASNDSTSEESSSRSESTTGINYTSMDKQNDDSDQAKSLITPTNFKARALFYPTMEQSQTLENDIEEFISAIFWVLESKRLDKLGLRKADRSLLLTSLCAPFEKKDFVGLDLESKNNKRRADGRLKKQLGDLCLQAGLPSEAITHYQGAIEILKSVNDWLWLAGSLEGMCSASVIALYPQLKRPQSLQRNSSLQNTESTRYKASNTNSLPYGLDPTDIKTTTKVTMRNCLSPNDILERYKESVTHYGKYRQAGIIETEASIKAALVLIEQRQTLSAAEFIQNAVFISLQLTEEEKMQRFNALSNLYSKLGFNRKAAFFKRVSAMRCVSPHNPQPNWALCHSFLLQTLDGYNLSIDPTEIGRFGYFGWPRLQIQVMQELVGTAKRKGNCALATRHMTLLFHTMLPHLNKEDRKDFAHQLEALTKEKEGNPQPMVLENGLIVPPVHMTKIPCVKVFKPICPTPHLKADKIEEKKGNEEISPFVYTPFSSNRDKVKDATKADFFWVENELSEVSILLENPLPIELKITSMFLMTEGVKLKVNPNVISIPADSTIFPTTLTAIPESCGSLRIIGYDISTLGVHSKVKLKNLPHSPFPYIDIEVVPALPVLEVETSKPKSEYFSSFCDSIVTSASMSLLMGETQECLITLKNNGKVPIEFLEMTLDSRMDSKRVEEIFKWDPEEVLSKLPIQPNESATIKMIVYGAGDFIGQPEGIGGGGGSSFGGENSSNASSLNTPNPSSFEGPSSLPSLPSLPSRLGAALRSAKRADSSASNRSGARSQASSNSNNSGKSPKMSVATNVKNYEGVLKIKYSGGPGNKTGHFRNLSISLNAEVSASLLITKWDTLPGESSSQFYLVLDVCNATQNEMEVHYSKMKQILIEKGETCRIPVEIDRYSNMTSIENQNEEKACCDHIVNNVDLKWILPELKEGKANLHGIRLSSNMVQLVQISPIQWEVAINGEIAKPDEMRFEAGEMINVDVWLKNHLKDELENVILSVDCFQDFQNGRINNKLDSRLAILGNESIFIPKIEPGNSFQHSVSLVFFVSGFYKIDFKCNKSSKDPSEGVNFKLDELIWIYNPPIDIQIIN